MEIPSTDIACNDSLIKYSTVNENGLNIIFHPNFYDKTRSDEIFEELQKLQFNSDENSQILIYGKWKNIPRKQVAFGNPNISYKFSGNEVPALEWPKFLKEIRDELQQHLIDIDILAPTTDHQINYVLVNLYRDGTDYISPHSDDEKDLEPIVSHTTSSHAINEVIIVSLSFGATRDFIFHKKSNTSIKYEIPLHHGDLLIMKGETQRFWRHSLPKRLKVKDPRINLTFRFMKEKKPIKL